MGAEDGPGALEENHEFGGRPSKILVTFVENDVIYPSVTSGIAFAGSSLAFLERS